MEEYPSCPDPEIDSKDKHQSMIYFKAKENYDSYLQSNSDIKLIQDQKALNKISSKEFLDLNRSRQNLPLLPYIKKSAVENKTKFKELKNLQRDAVTLRRIGYSLQINKNNILLQKYKKYEKQIILIQKFVRMFLIRNAMHDVFILRQMFIEFCSNIKSAVVFRPFVLLYNFRKNDEKACENLNNNSSYLNCKPTLEVDKTNSNNNNNYYSFNSYSACNQNPEEFIYKENGCTSNNDIQTAFYNNNNNATTLEANRITTVYRFENLSDGSSNKRITVKTERDNMLVYNKENFSDNCENCENSELKKTDLNYVKVNESIEDLKNLPKDYNHIKVNVPTIQTGKVSFTENIVEENNPINNSNSNFSPRETYQYNSLRRVMENISDRDYTPANKETETLNNLNNFNTINNNKEINTNNKKSTVDINSLIIPNSNIENIINTNINTNITNLNNYNTLNNPTNTLSTLNINNINNNNNFNTITNNQNSLSNREPNLVTTNNKLVTSETANVDEGEVGGLPRTFSTMNKKVDKDNIKDSNKETSGKDSQRLPTRIKNAIEASYPLITISSFDKSNSVIQPLDAESKVLLNILESTDNNKRVSKVIKVNDFNDVGESADRTVPVERSNDNLIPNLKCTNYGYITNENLFNIIGNSPLNFEDKTNRENFSGKNSQCMMIQEDFSEIDNKENSYVNSKLNSGVEVPASNLASQLQKIKTTSKCNSCFVNVQESKESTENKYFYIENPLKHNKNVSNLSNKHMIKSVKRKLVEKSTLKDNSSSVLTDKTPTVDCLLYRPIPMGNEQFVFSEKQLEDKNSNLLKENEKNLNDIIKNSRKKNLKPALHTPLPININNNMTPRILVSAIDRNSMKVVENKDSTNNNNNKIEELLSENRSDSTDIKTVKTDARNYNKNNYSYVHPFKIIESSEKSEKSDKYIKTEKDKTEKTDKKDRIPKPNFKKDPNLSLRSNKTTTRCSKQNSPLWKKKSLSHQKAQSSYRRNSSYCSPAKTEVLKKKIVKNNKKNYENQLINITNDFRKAKKELTHKIERCSSYKKICRTTLTLNSNQEIINIKIINPPCFITKTKKTINKNVKKIIINKNSFITKKKFRKKYSYVKKQIIPNKFKGSTILINKPINYSLDHSDLYESPSINNNNNNFTLANNSNNSNYINNSNYRENISEQKNYMTNPSLNNSDFDNCYSTAFSNFNNNNSNMNLLRKALRTRNRVLSIQDKNFDIINFSDSSLLNNKDNKKVNIRKLLLFYFVSKQIKHNVRLFVFNKFKMFCIEQCSVTLDDDYSQISGERLILNDTIFRDARFEMKKEKLQCVQERTKEDEEDDDDEIIINQDE